MKMIFLFLVIFLPAFNSAAGDTVSMATAQSYTHEQHFEADPEPVPVNIDGNPLRYAFKRIGLDPDTLNLPRAYENNYRTVARFPIIDYVSENPLYMKAWAEETAHHISDAHRADEISSAGVLLAILRGTSAFPGGSLDPEIDPGRWLEENTGDWPFTPGYKQILSDLIFKLIVAKIQISTAKRSLDEDDRDFFGENPGYYLAPDGARMPSLTGNVETHLNFIRRARKIEIGRILAASNAAAEAVHDYYRETAELRAGDIFYRGQDTTANFTYDTPLGIMIISGYGGDEHVKDASLLIDLGGDDTYLNNAGGCNDPRDDIRVCIDHSGNDVYDAGGLQYVQGFGFMGTGILADFEGDDVYRAGHFAQAGGILGTGILWDKAGNDLFEARAFCQGAGMFGLGLLLNDTGNDQYDCATLGQGAAMTLGMGVLSDLSGDDQYRLAVGDNNDALGRLPGYGQGGALSFRHYPWKGTLTPYGGVGMLVDNSGNDHYKSNGWCDQGGSYLLSLGVLYEGEGNDRYEARVGQGSGIHITNAILIDEGGNDYYRGEFRAGGSGGDRSPGFLLDYAGDDTYDSKTSSYGTGVKPYSLSLFIDFKGADHYICPEPKNTITFNNWDSFGGVWPESETYHWPYAIVLDLSGVDQYDVRNRADNSERHSFGHGIHLDTEWSGSGLFGNIENPLPAYTRLPLPDKIYMSPYRGLFVKLQSPDTYERFTAVGELADIGPELIILLVEVLKASNHRQYNRDLLEVLHIILNNNSAIGIENTDYIARLLRAEDPEVRTVIADNSRVWGLNLSEEELAGTALNDSDANVRRFALKSLMHVNSKAKLSSLRELAVADPSPLVRREAVEYIGEVEEEDNAYLLLSLILRDDESPLVQVAAAEALGKTDNPEAVHVLLEFRDTYDYYLKRAVGKSLCELYRVEGIRLLIESLAFPSIDAFENYNNNIPNYIAAYSGYDLPESRRYNREEWLRWFESNKDNIDIVRNVNDYREFRQFKESLPSLSAEQEIMRFEAFLDEHPENIHVIDELAEKLNQAAWDMVTAPKGTPSFDPVTGLRYARRATELKHDPNYFDTYAEALMVSGDYDGARRIMRDMLELYPDNEMFKERLEKINSMLGKSN